MSNLIERVEETAAVGQVDSWTWKALPALLKVTRAAYEEHELDRRTGDPCPGCPVCAEFAPLFEEAQP